MTIAKAYQKVNATWPAELPKLTADEAVRAARRLWRFGMGEVPRSVEVTSGRHRYTRAPYRNWLVVNPDRGWHAFVHDLSHAMYYWANDGTERPHSKSHAAFERKCVAEVLKRGWLDGRLRTPEKAPPSRREKLLAKAKSADARLKAWHTKAKRAQTAITKINRELARISRELNKEPTS